jgi:hypothetical protein
MKNSRHLLTLLVAAALAIAASLHGQTMAVNPDTYAPNWNDGQRNVPFAFDRETGALITGDQGTTSRLTEIRNRLPSALENNRLPVAELDQVTQSAVSLSATGVLFTKDMASSGLRTAVVQVTGTFVGTVTFEVSNNNTDWVTVAAYAPGDTGSTGASTTITAPGVRRIGVSEVFFRARVSAYTSGTITANAVYRAEPSRSYGVNVGNTTLTVLTRPSTSTTADGTSTFNTYVSNTTNTNTNISGTAAVITGGWVSNTATTWRWIKLFNLAAITPGTSSATINIGVPPGYSGPLTIPGYLRFGTGLQMLITTGIGLTDNTSTGTANEVAVTFYR